MALDRDLNSIQQARNLVETAHRAWRVLATFSQEKVDAIVAAMAHTALAHAERLAELAVKETGFGVIADKATKNRFAAKDVHEFFSPLKTVGVIRETDTLIEIAAPRGVVAAIIPTTNPTSTVIFKALISIKARNAVVFSPHPSAVGCITETARILREAAEAAGLPPGAIGCMTIATLQGTEALMKHERTAVILATGGTGLVKSAYSSGKPAFGVGPGNVPVLIERSADVPKAVADIIAGKTFDNGTVCASEQAVVVEAPLDGEVRKAFEARRGYFLSAEEAEKLARVVYLPMRGLNPAIVGRSVGQIAAMAGITVPADTCVMLAKLDGVGKDHPLSIEKLSPILAYYVAPDFAAGTELCAEVLRFGGMGHSVGIHSNDRDRIREFGLRQPASRILVNTPTTHGAIGFSTDLSPSMTLGCGSWGGNVTSDNISPIHLVDVKRVAFETFPVTKPATASTPLAVTVPVSVPTSSPVVVSRPVPPERSAIAALVDQFVSQKRARIEQVLRAAPPVVPPVAPPVVPSPAAPPVNAPAPAVPPATANGHHPGPVDFVCEDDVRRALREDRKIVTNGKTIITPAARDLGTAHDIFIDSSNR